MESFQETVAAVSPHTVVEGDEKDVQLIGGGAGILATSSPTPTTVGIPTTPRSDANCDLPVQWYPTCPSLFEWMV